MNFETFIQQYGQPVKAAKNDHLFMQGDKNHHLYSVRQGLLKAYYVSTHGKESVKSFILPGDVIGSLNAVYGNKPSSFNVLCLQDSLLVKIPFDTLYTLTEKDPTLARDMTDILLALAMKKEQREYEFLCLSAEERFRLLMERSPELIAAITQNDIARYLGMTPVALSRIKKRLNGNGLTPG